MILAENRVSFGDIYVPETDFENCDSQTWFIAEQLRYYLARVTLAPFQIKINNGEDADGLYISLDTSYTDD